MDAKPSTAQKIIVCIMNMITIILVTVVVLLHVADWRRMLSKASKNNFSLKKHKAVTIITFSVCMAGWCILDAAYISGHKYFHLHDISCFIVNVIKIYLVLVIFCLRLGNYVKKLYAVFCFGKHSVSLLVSIQLAVLTPVIFLCTLFPSIKGVSPSCLLLAKDAAHYSILGFMILCSCSSAVLFCVVFYGKWLTLKTLFPSWELKLKHIWKSSLIQSFLIIQPALWLIAIVHALAKETERSSKPWVYYVQSGIFLYMGAVLLIYETLICDEDKRRPFRFQRRKDAANDAAEVSHHEQHEVESLITSTTKN